MGVYRDGGEPMGPSEEAIRLAIERSGDAISDRLAKMIAGMPRGEVIRLLGGEMPNGVDEQDAESIRLIARKMGASKGMGSSNFKTLGEDSKVEAGEGVDETIRLLGEMED